MARSSTWGAPRLRALVLSAALVAVLATAGCTTSGSTAPASPTPGGDATPSGETTQTPAAPPDAATIRATGQAMTVGGVTLAAASTGAAPPAAATRADGTVDLTASVTAADDLLLAAPEGTSVDVSSDGSAVVRDQGGTAVAGLAPPSAHDAAGTRIRVRATASSDLLTLTLDPASTVQPPVTVTVWLAERAIDHVEWGEREGGRSLAVFPTAWGRTGGLAAEQAGWEAVVALAPDADTNGMHDQFICHTIGAPDKESWNLEPWRPDVGSLATLAARCNPTS